MTEHGSVDIIPDDEYNKLKRMIGKKLCISLRIIRAKRMMLSDMVDIGNYNEISYYLYVSGEYLKAKHNLK